MLEEGDLVLCTVDRIAGTVVFVKIEGEEKEGSIILSEIAPGRIRNLREYVVPKKKIVCKVLRNNEETISLSLRRVNQKERKEVLDEYNQEKSYISILKTILKDQSEEIISKITRERRLYSFFEDVKNNPPLLEKIVGKENSKKILEIILEQKKKKIKIKKTIHLKTLNSEGLYQIKKILDLPEEIDAKYISAGKYSLILETDDGKKGEQRMKEILDNMEKKSKDSEIIFEVKEK